MWLASQWWRTDRLDERHPLRWLLIATATLVVAWLPPVIQQFQRGYGQPAQALRPVLRSRTCPSSVFRPRSRQWSAGSTSSAHGSSIRARTRAARPTTSVSFCSSCWCGVGGTWAWKRRERVELSAVRRSRRGDCTGTPVDDANLRRLPRLRDQVDVAAGRYVDRHQPVVVLADMASAVAGVGRAIPRGRHRCDHRRPSLSRPVGVGRRRQRRSPVPARQRDDRCACVAARDLARPDQAVPDQRVRSRRSGFGRIRAGAGVGTARASALVSGRGESPASCHSGWSTTWRPTRRCGTSPPARRSAHWRHSRGRSRERRSTSAHPPKWNAPTSWKSSCWRRSAWPGGPSYDPCCLPRWGHTALALVPDLPADAARLLKQYNNLRQPAAVIELPLGVNGYVINPPLGSCST